MTIACNVKSHPLPRKSGDDTLRNIPPFCCDDLAGKISNCSGWKDKTVSLRLRIAVTMRFKIVGLPTGVLFGTEGDPLGALLFNLLKKGGGLVNRPGVWEFGLCFWNPCGGEGDVGESSNFWPFVRGGLFLGVVWSGVCSWLLRLPVSDLSDLESSSPSLSLWSWKPSRSVKNKYKNIVFLTFQ